MNLQKIDEKNWRLINDKTDGEEDKVILSIKDKVYDITEYLELHPGGSEILEEQNMKDATQFFEEVGHSATAKETMIKYEIGTVIEREECKVSHENPERNTFVYKIICIIVLFVSLFMKFESVIGIQNENNTLI